MNNCRHVDWAGESRHLPEQSHRAKIDDDDDDVIIFTCVSVLGHTTHGEIYYVVMGRDNCVVGSGEGM